MKFTLARMDHSDHIQNLLTAGDMKVLDVENEALAAQVLGLVEK